MARLLDAMRRRKNACERKEEKRNYIRVPEGGRREEQSEFIPRAFVNLPREHITAVRSSLQTEMRKVGGGCRRYGCRPVSYCQRDGGRMWQESMNSGSYDGGRVSSVAC